MKKVKMLAWHEKKKNIGFYSYKEGEPPYYIIEYFSYLAATDLGNYGIYMINKDKNSWVLHIPIDNSDIEYYGKLKACMEFAVNHYNEQVEKYLTRRKENEIDEPLNKDIRENLLKLDFNNLNEKMKENLLDFFSMFLKVFLCKSPSDNLQNLKTIMDLLLNMPEEKHD